VKSTILDFIRWLNPKQHLKWLEIGCGTGALTKAIATQASPLSLLAIDKSESYIEKARENVRLNTVAFHHADLNTFQAAESYDQITSGLVLNFIPDVAICLKYP